MELTYKENVIEVFIEHHDCMGMGSDDIAELVKETPIQVMERWLNKIGYALNEYFLNYERVELLYDVELNDNEYLKAGTVLNIVREGLQRKDAIKVEIDKHYHESIFPGCFRGTDKPVNVLIGIYGNDLIEVPNYQNTEKEIEKYIQQRISFLENSL